MGKPLYTLVLIRHGKSESSGYMSDFERELVPSGRKTVVKNTKELKNEHKIIPDILISSSAVRTAQTAQIVLDVFKKRKIDDVFYNKNLYSANELEMLDLIKAYTHKIDSKTCAVIGHNPSISSLAFELSNEFAEHKKSSTKHFSYNLAPGSICVLTSPTKFSSWNWGCATTSAIIHQ
ncbi:MAG: histidine phosphatase family protein [Candidatus Ancillula sp.]|jgi:phosphohistidine phosphatase|nr:histidine phosphatase family protein [Candidatus Ancillula sp.]